MQKKEKISSATHDIKEEKGLVTIRGKKSAFKCVLRKEAFDKQYEIIKDKPAAQSQSGQSK